MSLTPGSRLGPYEIVAPLGAGGMGEVFLAQDLRLPRRVALKILPAAFAADESRVRRFEQEARAVSALNHPNVLTLFDLGQAGDRYYMATEYIDGRTLRALLRERRRLPASEAIGIIRQCASALTVAHAAGIVHRDIKPENVMIRPDGYVKVLDFGLAKLLDRSTSTDETVALDGEQTSAGVVLGTVGYLSPEQGRGQGVDARTDIFSLGVVLFEMLTGVQPFAGPTPSDTLASILRSEPPPLSALLPNPPAELQRVVSRMLSKDRDDRHASAAEVAADLDAVLVTRSDGALSVVPGAMPRASWLSVRTIAIAAAIVAMAIVAAVALWPRGSGQTTDPAADAAAVVRSLAVLPFKLLGYPPGQEHLGLGMADALIVKLTHLRQLTVRPTTAVIKYQDAPGEADVVARALEVDAVLTGNIQRAGGRVRITVQLVGSGGGANAMRSIWSDEFTTTTDDPFEVQERLAAQLVEKLALHLTGDERSRLARPDSANAHAVRLYMEGRYFMNKRAPAAYTRALELFTAAVTEDPRYAKALLGQVLAWHSLMEGGVLPPAETQTKMRGALARAIESDPGLGEAYGYRSLLSRAFDWRFEEADADSLRSMELAPNSPMVLQWRGVHLLAFGRADEAVALHRRSAEIDPADTSVRAQLCRALYLASRFDEAVATGQALIQLDPNQSSSYQWVGLAQVALGRHDAGIRALEQAVTLTPENTERVAALAWGYARAAQPEKARAMMRRIVPPVDSYHLATVRLALGEVDAAIALLERAWQQHDPFLANRGRLDPKLDPIRGDPRVRSVIDRMR